MVAVPSLRERTETLQKSSDKFERTVASKTSEAGEVDVIAQRELTLGKNQTKPHISAEDRGEPNVKNDSSDSDLLLNVVQSRAETIQQRKAIALRLSELAERISISRNISQRTANVALLKRELSQSHTMLGAISSEGDYLSILTLIEGCLTATSLRSASANFWRTICGVIRKGVTDNAVSFDDYRYASRELKGGGVQSGPIFDVDYEEQEDHREK